VQVAAAKAEAPAAEPAANDFRGTLKHGAGGNSALYSQFPEFSIADIKHYKVQGSCLLCCLSCCYSIRSFQLCLYPAVDAAPDARYTYEATSLYRPRT